MRYISSGRQWIISVVGEKAFDSEEAARQDANKKNSVRFRLVCECQEDFENALNERGIYGSLLEKRLLLSNGSDQTNTEEVQAELELLEHKLKRRVLGTIRFIGE